MRAEEFKGTTINPAAEMIAEESAKTILQNTDEYLEALGQVLLGIENAIFEPQPQAKEPEEADRSLLSTLRRQRATVEELLGIAEHIRRGLW